MDRRRKNRKAFTLAELLVTLVITGILLSALATLAFALSSASRVANDSATMQAQLRHGTLRLQGLLWNCRLICAVEGNALAIWEADDNQDGQINVNELVYLDRGAAGDTLQLCWFSSVGNPHVTFSSGGLSMTKAELISSHNGAYLALMPDAQNVAFDFGNDPNNFPPLTQWLTTSFDLTENGTTSHYQIDTALRAWAGHVLNAAGDALVGDDDE